jgi:SAM-dependent methyltransferase
MVEVVSLSDSKEICDLCGQTRPKLVNRLSEFQIVRCRYCGLIWRSPRPTVEGLAEFYQGEPYSSQVETQRAIIAKKENLTISRILDRLKEDCGIWSGELLDVGCGYGFMLQAAEARGFTVCGLEPSPKMGAEAQKLVKGVISCGLIEHADYSNNRFDVITMLDVLEHAACPTLVLRKVTRILRPEGILVIRVPDVDGLLIRMMGVLHTRTLGRYQYPTWLLWRYHSFGFTASTLTGYMEKMGLKVICHYGEHSKDLSTLNKKPWATNPIVRLGVHLAVRTSKLLDMPDEVVMFAQKPT